jgi:hypothetical protein
MPSTVFVNSRGVVHKGSGGVSTVFPDVCKTPTPAGSIPIPYPNVAMSANTLGGPTTVTTDKMMPMVKGAKYPLTSGDEAGVAGGVSSGVNMQEAEFLLYSFDVKYEGNNVCRMGDPMLQNKKNIMG